MQQFLELEWFGEWFNILAKSSEVALIGFLFALVFICFSLLSKCACVSQSSVGSSPYHMEELMTFWFRICLNRFHLLLSGTELGTV